MKLERYASGIQTFSPKAPAVTKVEVKGTNLNFTFDRPVQAGSQFLAKIDGVSLASTALTQVGGNTAGNYVYELNSTTHTLTTAQLKAGNHEVVLYDVKDTAASNPVTTAVINTSYTVTDEATAPKVKSITAVNSNRFFIEFDQALKNEVALGGGPANFGGEFKLEVLKGDHQFLLGSNGGAGTETAFDATAPNKDDSDVYISAKTTYDNKSGYFVIITDKTATEENPLYRTGETSTKLTVKVSDFRNTNDLLGSVHTGSVTLAKDTATPTVKSTELATDTLTAAQTSDGTYAVNTLRVTFDGAIAIEDATKIVVRDKNGVIITPTGSALKKANTVLELTLSKVTDEPYTVEFKDEAVRFVKNIADIHTYTLVESKNKNQKVTVQSGTANQYKYYALEGVVTPTAASDKISIPYAVEMDSATALNVANYKLDGKALPAGSSVDFVGDTKNVQITLPAGSLSVSGDYLLEISTNVKTKENQQVVNNLRDKSTFSYRLAGITDNVKPNLVSAKYLVTDLDANVVSSTAKYELTFSEKVKLNSDNAGDVIVEVGGNKFAATISEDATANDEKLILTLDSAKTVSVKQDSTITILPENAQADGKLGILDLANNKVNPGSITVKPTDKLLDVKAIADAAALVLAAENAVAAYEALPLASDANITAAVGYNKTALNAAIAALPTADQTAFNNRVTAKDGLVTTAATVATVTITPVSLNQAASGATASLAVTAKNADGVTLTTGLTYAWSITGVVNTTATTTELTTMAGLSSATAANPTLTTSSAVDSSDGFVVQASVTGQKGGAVPNTVNVVAP